MGEILFLAHRMPFPPDRGDKIRSHHVLKALARLAPVHVATFADEDADWAGEAELVQLAASHCLVARRKPLALAALEALATGKPVSLTAFHAAPVANYVRHVLATRPIEAIYVFSGQMAQYVPEDFRGRVVADLVDVDSAKFEAYAAAGRAPRRWMEAREARLLRCEEARIAARAQVSLLVSEPEAQLFRDRLAEAGKSVRVMGNGIDARAFAPGACPPDAAMAAAGFPRIVFTGQMDYAPNIAAVERGARAILPRVRRAFPEASLHVVGRNPTRAVEALGTLPGVRVWGRVPDVRPYLAAADVALVPLRLARGVQNKVLEAMAMAVPTVVSLGAATGIPAADGTQFLVREDDEAMADAVIDLASDAGLARTLGRSARAWIEENASWEAALANLPAYCGFDAKAGGMCDVA
ncbi:TIGR03087 family PEP-CTERM/XrtA system glycosyltransferase [Novosphingobium profundi]|uniref:TIGR03087 family PEP-CTERM/XrtA system glycosyltransferase n=1 Tax=Novosphingobium profundi TaxID=1774954 RepID=UPI001BDB0CA8|nr:TIGR03087 family PEP-CTERM/XrtA system glycosyltransferase [Novosphingobium profundi]MBT0669121.1 TIGR03087 family PEP-CTERM/XrtA system glycosyltransferase [Novosphingobium profundi]